jgi:hypothetical protein
MFCQSAPQNTYVYLSTFLCRCLCPDGWYGPTCAINFNPCDSMRHNCSSGATCVPLSTGYECDCPLGKAGKYCERGMMSWHWAHYEVSSASTTTLLSSVTMHCTVQQTGTNISEEALGLDVPCTSGYLLVSIHADPGSIPGSSMWDL